MSPIDKAAAWDEAMLNVSSSESFYDVLRLRTEIDVLIMRNLDIVRESFGGAIANYYENLNL
jgi:hypothetical protein